jgi:hypothetical protein
MTKKLFSTAAATTPMVLLAIFFCICSATCTTAAPKPTTKPKPTTTTAPLGFWEQMNAAPDPLAAPQPKWIWGPTEAKPGEERFFRITFDAKLPTTYMTENPSSAWIWCAADDEMTLYLNGKPVARSGGWDKAIVADVRSLLKPGQNVLAAKVRNDTGPAALSVKLELRGTYREPFQSRHRHEVENLERPGAKRLARAEI